MITFFALNVIVVVAALLLFALLAVRKLGRRTKLDHLERIANRFHGSVVALADEHCVQMRIKGQTYRVRICDGTEEYPNSFLSVSTLWIPRQVPQEKGVRPDRNPANFCMSVTSAQSWNGLSDSQDMEIGNEFFDNRFSVQTNDVQLLVDTLTTECQSLIHKIYVQFYERCELRIAGNQLQLDSAFRSFRPGKTFVIIRCFAELYQALLLANEVAHAMDVDAIDLGGTTTCLICGDVVDVESVKCRSCLTEYHRDCWEYVGRCGRYACGDQYYVASQK